MRVLTFYRLKNVNDAIAISYAIPLVWRAGAGAVHTTLLKSVVSHEAEIYIYFDLSLKKTGHILHTAFCFLMFPTQLRACACSLVFHLELRWFFS